MEYQDIVDRLKKEGFADLRVGSSMQDLYWIRDEAVPALLFRIDELYTQIDGLKAAVSREGAMNQGGL